MVNMTYEVACLPQKKWGQKQIVDWKAIRNNDKIKYNNATIVVVNNEMITKVSKTGNTRKERRITIKLGTMLKEVGTESFKKGSFLKRMLKSKVEKVDYLNFILKRYEMKLLLPEPKDEFAIFNEMNTQEIHNYIYNEFNSLVDDDEIDYYEEDDIKKLAKNFRRIQQKYAKRFHSDLGGSEEIMTIVNNVSRNFNELINSLYEFL